MNNLSPLDEKQLKPEFYVISKSKLSILYLSTFGFYFVYWLYRNWQLYAKHNKEENIMPIARTIFLFIFIFSLFFKIKHRLLQQNPNSDWLSETNALILFFLLILSTIFFIVGNMGLMILALLLHLLGLYSLLEAQQAINRAMSDPEGDTNNKFRFINYFWMVLGGLFIVFWAWIAFEDLYTVLSYFVLPSFFLINCFRYRAGKIDNFFPS